ncbi:MAG: hypothetical protein Q8P05_05145 [Candidatus Diapherotrites archaeon]|nr:hypothetical protein [Candidatus Diapherotrites archaeon]MDZ4256830.1 hypothetical protein [archaeon]
MNLPKPRLPKRTLEKATVVGVHHTTRTNSRVNRNVARVIEILRELKKRGDTKVGIECLEDTPQARNNPPRRYFHALYLRAKRMGIQLVEVEDNKVFHLKTLVETLSAPLRAKTHLTVGAKYFGEFTQKELHEIINALNYFRSIRMAEIAKAEKLNTFIVGGKHAMQLNTPSYQVVFLEKHPDMYHARPHTLEDQRVREKRYFEKWERLIHEMYQASSVKSNRARRSQP